MSSSNIPANRELPLKCKEIFSTLHKYYEKKDYINGLKSADQILDKHPTHGETLAMKGLMLHSKGDREDGYKCVKEGVKNDMQSGVCWHVYGLLYKGDLNFKEATKCYLNAMRMDRGQNANIIRDLSWLQIQMRDYHGFAESRRQILTMRPSVKTHWIAYIVATYFAGTYELTNSLINSYKDAWPVEPNYVYEESEIILFQTRCLEKQGKYQEAIDQLQKYDSIITDKMFSLSKSAELTLLLGHFEDAVVKWLHIVKDNPENYRFHACLQSAILQLNEKTCLEIIAMKQLHLPCNVLALTSDQKMSIIAVYREHELIQSKAVEKIMLELLEGHEFDTALTNFMIKRIREGVPSLYQDIKGICRVEDPLRPSMFVYAKDPTEFAVHPVSMTANRICDALISSLKATGSFEDSRDQIEAPSALLWALFLKCSLLEMSGLYSKALVVLEECIGHTPTAPDVIAKKAKLLRKSGDYASAAVVMDSCCRVDLQDRYLNNKATKYFLRADLMPEAMGTIALFTKHDGDPQKILYELQCVWYENKAGESYARLGDLGQALKKFLATEKHFIDHSVDMHEFHPFCLRKATLRTYEEVLNLVDGMFSNKYFQIALRGAIGVYLKLIDVPKGTSVAKQQIPPPKTLILPEGEELSQLTPAEQKKLKEKLRKKQKQKEKKEKKDEEMEDTEGKEAADGDNKDAEEMRAILSKDPLEEAYRLCASLVKLPIAEPESQALAFEVYLRKNKLTLALRCLIIGLNASPYHPALTPQLVRFGRLVQGAAGAKPVFSEVVREVVLPALAGLLNNMTVEAFVTDFAARASGLPLPFRVSAAKCLIAINGSKESRLKAAMLITDESAWAGKGISVETVLAAYEVLLSDFGLPEVAAAYRDRCIQQFPLANAFGQGLQLKRGEDLAFLPVEVLAGEGEHSA